jgi:hypothetical protein
VLQCRFLSHIHAKTKINAGSIQRFSSYRTENKSSLHHKDEHISSEKQKEQKNALHGRSKEFLGAFADFRKPIKVLSNIETNILFSVTSPPPPPENRVVYEVMSKIMVQPEKPQTIWRMSVSCWISKATRMQAHARACAPTHMRACTHT